jgi:hypothetical protein
MQPTFVPDRLAVIDSLTKYPSIPVLHALDSRGRAVGDRCTDHRGAMQATIKYDGTNIRLVVNSHGDMLIGYREHLVWAKGDRVHTADSFGVVPTVLTVADRLVPREGVRVVYMELCGGKIGKYARRYTPTPEVQALRVFDAHTFTEAEWDESLTWEPQAASSWRDHLHQRWVSRASLEEFGIPLVESFTVTAPETPDDVRAMLAAHAENHEGLVLRTDDRRVCFKIRHENYRK